MQYTIDNIKQRLEAGLAHERTYVRGAAVLIPLIATDNGFDVLFEERSHELSFQPGEVCLPGGKIELGETPRQAVIRETCEELLVRPEQIEIIAEMDEMIGTGGIRVWPFVGVLRDYEGTFDIVEVHKTFRVALQWLIDNPSEIHKVQLPPTMADDFPWELVPGGHNYNWHPRPGEVPFFRGTDPLVWGMTARVINAFLRLIAYGEKS